MVTFELEKDHWGCRHTELQRTERSRHREAVAGGPGRRGHSIRTKVVAVETEGNGHN